MADKPNRSRRPFSSPTAALLWEQWRLFRPFLAGVVCMAVMGTLGLYINLLQHTVSRRDVVEISDFVRGMCGTFLPALFCANFCGGVSFPGRLYRLPVTTRRMVLYVAVPRLLFMLFTILFLLGFRMMLLGAPDWNAELRMIVLSMEALIAGLALSWSLGAVRNWLAVLALTGIVVGAWYLYDILGIKVVWELSADTLWPLAALWALLWGLAVFAGPDRARSGFIGVRMSWRGKIHKAKARPLPGGPNQLRRFASPFEAQVWYERRTRGYAGLLYPLLFVLFTVLAMTSGSLLDVGRFYPDFFLTMMIAALSAGLCFIAAASRGLMELHRVRAGRFRFLAAKPISTQDMARARLHAMWRGAETAALFAAAMFAFFWLLPPMPLLMTTSIWPLWLADAYQSLNGLALAWMLIWLVLLWCCASLTVVSTPKALALVFAWPLLQLGTVYEPVRWVVSEGGDEVAIALTGVLLAAHVAGLFVRAWRRGLISPVTVLLCCVLYIVLAQMLVRHMVEFLLPDGYFPSWKPYAAWTMEMLGVITLAVAPVAALPLQFDRWRHGGK